mmetsp:Transcript_34254/g.80019  ORF Transcript_34254/g.80019 Transcript_34254/m.80019 type:complete len:230 (-) Transcript_34254:271-960(-)
MLETTTSTSTSTSASSVLTTSSSSSTSESTATSTTSTLSSSSTTVSTLSSSSTTESSLSTASSSSTTVSTDSTLTTVSSQSSVSSTSTSSSATPSPCLEFCDLIDNTVLGQGCNGMQSSVTSLKQCTSSFVRPGSNSHIRCKIQVSGFQVKCVEQASSEEICPSSDFSACSCRAKFVKSNQWCRRKCHATATFAGSYNSLCGLYCNNGCDANGARRLKSLRGATRRWLK